MLAIYKRELNPISVPLSDFYLLQSPCFSWDCISVFIT